MKFDNPLRLHPQFRGVPREYAIVELLSLPRNGGGGAVFGRGVLPDEVRSTRRSNDLDEIESF